MHTYAINTQSIRNDSLLNTRQVRRDSASDAPDFAQYVRASGSGQRSGASDEVVEETPQAPPTEDQTHEDELGSVSLPMEPSAETPPIEPGAVTPPTEPGAVTPPIEPGAVTPPTEPGTVTPPSETVAETLPSKPDSVSNQGGKGGKAERTPRADDHRLDKPEGAVQKREKITGSPVQRVIPAGRSTIPLAKPIEENTQAGEVALRVLEKQSEQAKLSIKGLVRSLTQGAGADTTAIAVETRLGQDQSTDARVLLGRATPSEAARTDLSQQPQHPTESHPDQGQVESTGTRTDTPRVDSSPPVSTDPRAIQPPIETGQIASQQVDVASAVSQTQSNTVGDDATRAIKNQSAHRLAGMNQAHQAVRAISGIDAGNSTNSGNVGHHQSDSNTGSLVEKMRASEMPTQAKRAGVLAQVQRGLASLLRSGKGEMTLRLTPGHLGEVRIRIKAGDSGLSIRFETSSKEATELLNSGVKELGANLRGKGIALDQIHIQSTPIQDSPSGDAGTALGDAQSQQSDEHTNPEDARHHNARARADIEHGADDQPEEPESIWTEHGLDAVA